MNWLIDMAMAALDALTGLFAPITDAITGCVDELLDSFKACYLEAKAAWNSRGTLSSGYFGSFFQLLETKIIPIAIVVSLAYTVMLKVLNPIATAFPFALPIISLAVFVATTAALIGVDYPESYTDLTLPMTMNIAVIAAWIIDRASLPPVDNVFIGSIICMIGSGITATVGLCSSGPQLSAISFFAFMTTFVTIIITILGLAALASWQETNDAIWYDVTVLLGYTAIISGCITLALDIIALTQCKGFAEFVAGLALTIGDGLYVLLAISLALML